MNSGDPADIWTFYQRVLDALDIVFSVARKGVVLPAGARSNQLVGLTPEELRDVLRDTRSELDHEVTLSLAAAFESILIRDCLQQSIGTGRLAAGLRKLGRPERVTHRDVLDVWKTVHAAAGDVIGRFKEVVNFRDWLAHGRRWPPKGSGRFDPALVWKRAEDLQKAIPGFPVLVPHGTQQLRAEWL